jgi:hypothetical protein
MVQKERRWFPRYHAPESLAATAEFTPRREQRLQVQDISIDGLSFVTKVNIIGETFFNLSLEMTDKDGRCVRINTPAKILWSTFDEKASLYTAGVLFLGLKDADRELLQGILSPLTPKKSL